MIEVWSPPPRRRRLGRRGVPPDAPGVGADGVTRVTRPDIAADQLVPSTDDPPLPRPEPERGGEQAEGDRHEDAEGVPGKAAHGGDATARPPRAPWLQFTARPARLLGGMAGDGRL